MCLSLCGEYAGRNIISCVLAVLEKEPVDLCLRQDLRELVELVCILPLN